ncbi:ribonuclease P protein component [Methylibium sp.]|uniref:ribonuclease P protein component n=1 Tax=Methylibium sp. TaxID=2067992 RepID=UPI0018158DC9|nr:ribonuclease P protein component [Methylibium sp.]MBA3588762.1 ribonuclease P protein component [Methylibium sp.]
MSPASGGADLRAADFERALSSRPCARSEHFFLHHVACAAGSPAPKLSTDQNIEAPAPVDDRLRFGLVVPKRHARRSVTRSLIKRQGRTAFASCAEQLVAGDWLLRLRSPYPIDQFPSAASVALQDRVRDELQALFVGASRASAPASVRKSTRA